VPRLSYFYGIAAYVYYEDHPASASAPALWRAQGQGVSRKAEVIEGSLPRRAARSVPDWVAEHPVELAAC
jgi:hypothetical protein